MSSSMIPSDPEDFSEDGEQRLNRRIAEEALGLRFDEIRQSGSAANMVGTQSEHLLFSQRLDSRTYFVQDTRYGIDQEEGTFEGSDEEFLAESRSILERLDIPLSEVGDELVLKEQTQVAEADRYGRVVRMQDVREGKKFARISRRLEGLSVWSSNLTLGLTKSRQIGFMQLHWPEIPERVVTEARKLAHRVERGWSAPVQPGATVESVEAGIIHSPPISLVMDIYPTIRVIYKPLDESFGRKATLYLDRHGNNIAMPREFDDRAREEEPLPPRPDPREAS